MTPAPRRKRRLLVAAICVAGLASVFGLAKALHLFSGDGDSQPLILRLIEIKPQGERPSLPQDAYRVAAKQARAQARFVSTLDDQSQLDRLGPGSREALDEWMTACTLVPQDAWAMLVIAICQGQASVAKYMEQVPQGNLSGIGPVADLDVGKARVAPGGGPCQPAQRRRLL